MRKLTPIQMPHIDMDEAKEVKRPKVLIRYFAQQVWSQQVPERERWLLGRMIPLIENNLCELGPGASPIYIKKYQQ